METSLTSSMTSFPVKELKEFKEITLNQDEFLARKIEKNNGKVSKGVIIPALTQEQLIVMLDNETILEACRNYMQSVVEEVVKVRMDTHKLVYLDDMNQDCVVNWLQEQEIKNDRVSKAKIEQWFDADVSPKIHARMCELYPELPNDKMVETLKLYKTQFAYLAKREYVFAPQVQDKIKAAIALAGDCSMKEWAMHKLEQLCNNVQDTMVAL